jgi:ketosteroid isomerase-like protein
MSLSACASAGQTGLRQPDDKAQMQDEPRRMCKMHEGMEHHPMKDGMPHFKTEGSAVNAVTSVLSKYSAAIAAMDVDAMAMYVVASDDFSIIEGSHPNWGWADYRDNHLKPEFESDVIEIKSYAYRDFQVSAMHMIAYATFKVSLEATVRGEEITRERMGTAILIRTKEGWKIRHLHTS